MRRLFLCGVAIGLLGCASAAKRPISVAFDDLTNESRSKMSGPIRYSTFVSVSGLVPDHHTQMFYYQPPGLSPTHSLGLSPKWTFRVRREYPLAAGVNGASTVATIRNAYTQLQGDTLRLGALKATIAAGEAALRADTPAPQKARFRDIAIKALGIQGAAADDAGIRTVLEAKQAEAVALETEVAAKHKQLAAAVEIGNVLITRWTANESEEAKATVSEIAGTEYSKKESRGGVLILGDLLVDSLHVGEDFLDLIRSLPEGQKRLYTKSTISVFEVRAKYVAYVADLDLVAAVSAYLKLSKEELADVAKALGNASLQAEMAAGRTADLGSSALLNAPTVTTERRPFYPPRLLEAELRNDIARDGNYQTIYSVRAQVSALTFYIASRESETELSRIDPCQPGASTRLNAWLDAVVPADIGLSRPARTDGQLDDLMKETIYDSSYCPIPKPTPQKPPAAAPTTTAALSARQ